MLNALISASSFATQQFPINECFRIPQSFIFLKQTKKPVTLYNLRDNSQS